MGGTRPCNRLWTEATEAYDDKDGIPGSPHAELSCLSI